MLDRGNRPPRAENSTGTGSLGGRKAGWWLEQIVGSEPTSMLGWKFGEGLQMGDGAVKLIWGQSGGPWLPPRERCFRFQAILTFDCVKSLEA